THSESAPNFLHSGIEPIVHRKRLAVETPAVFYHFIRVRRRDARHQGYGIGVSQINVDFAISPNRKEVHPAGLFFHYRGEFGDPAHFCNGAKLRGYLQTLAVAGGRWSTPGHWRDADRDRLIVDRL